MQFPSFFNTIKQREPWYSCISYFTSYRNDVYNGGTQVAFLVERFPCHSREATPLIPLALLVFIRVSFFCMQISRHLPTWRFVSYLHP